MATSARVLNYSAGNSRAEVLFVGEAPGRLGADETEVPFHGDQSGRNFEDLLAFAGMNRSEIFVTNAVLCNPKDEDGNNATPNAAEVLNCAGFLRRQIEVVNPRIVVPLGAVALRALNLVSPHELQLALHVRTIQPWFGRHLIPLYHPGQRAMIHRAFANQRSDYQFVSEQWRRLSVRPQKPTGVTKAGILKIAQNLLNSRGEVSYFELHKLAYLVEYVHVRRFGRRVTSGYFIRQKDGPYCTDLQIDRLTRADASIRILNRGGRLILMRKGATQTDLFGEDEEELSLEIKGAIEEVLQRYNYKSEAELKTAVYLTAPMRYILRREQREKINLYNAPIDFLAAT
jgi:uracil-DNA glycosylase family 4